MEIEKVLIRTSNNPNSIQALKLAEQNRRGLVKLVYKENPTDNSANDKIVVYTLNPEKLEELKTKEDSPPEYTLPESSRRIVYERNKLAEHSPSGWLAYNYYTCLLLANRVSLPEGSWAKIFKSKA